MHLSRFNLDGAVTGSTLGVTRYKKNWFWKCLFSNEPLHKILLFAKQTLAISLIYPVHYILFIPPSWVWLDLLSTFVLTPFFIFTEEDPDFVPDDVE